MFAHPKQKVEWELEALMLITTVRISEEKLAVHTLYNNSLC